MSLPRERKKVIYALWKRNALFTRWKELLSENFKVKTFLSVDRFLELVLFRPPDLIIYHFEKSPEGFTTLIKDIKLHFNLVKLPIVLVVEELVPEKISEYLSAIDDFLLIDAGPSEILLRIELSLRRIERVSDNNPLTGLPGNVSIEKKLKELLECERPMGVVYVDLDNFKAYNDIYGFAKGDEMIKNVARLLVNTVNRWTRDGFVGHIGGDDFIFIVPMEVVENIAEEVIRNFNSLIPSFVNKKDFERGYFISKDRQGNLVKFPLPSLSIAIVPVHKGKFKHIGEIAERASQVKKIVKSIKGSAYFIDRRA